MADIVILGAGLTGLSAAYHLEQLGFSDYKIFEKEKEVGGLCRSINHDGFTFDYTGHLLHTSDAYFRNLIQSIGLDNFENISRRSFIYSQDIYTKYPYQINLHGLPVETMVECIEGFANRPNKKKITKTFHQWVLENFGAGIAKHFFFPYQEKIFSYPVKKLSASWTGKFVPQTSLSQIIKGSLSDKSEESIGYNSEFLYPKMGGIYFWIEKFAQKIKQPIYKEFCAEQIDIKNKVIKFSNGHVEKFKQLITTMPLDILLENIKEASDTFLKQSKSNLLCNSVVNFNIGVNHPNLSDKHWIYYPEQKYPFYRIGFPHNFSKGTVPNGCSSLYGEFSYLKKPTLKINDNLTTAISETKKLLKISQEDIKTIQVINIKHAYVIYNSWRDNNLPTILEQLKQQNIYSVGRYGEWKYSSMQDAVLDGKKVIESIYEKVL